MLQALLIDGDRRTMLNWPADRAAWEEGTGLLWLDLQPSAADEIEALAGTFRLHPAVVRACIHPEHRAKLKEYKDHVLLVLNAVGRGLSEGGAKIAGGQVYDPRARDELARWRTLELNVIFGERFLITVHPDAVPAVSLLFQRYGKGEGRPTLEYLLYSLCEAIANGYYVVLDRVDRFIDEAEDMIFRGDVNRQVVDRLFTLKRHVLYLRRVLGPQRDALGALMRREFSHLLAADARPYLVDVYEHTLRLFDLLDTYRDLISSSLDAYLSTVSNQTNDIMKVLTIVSTLLMPLTLVSGIFGMNFASMPLLDHPWGFWATMLVMAAITVLMALYFKRRKWL